MTIVRPVPRNMSYGYLYHNPFDVFKWVDEAYAPFKLLSVGRHPQGWYMALYKLLWDGVEHVMKVDCTARHFLYQPIPFDHWEIYAKNTATSRTALLILRDLPIKTMFQIAQDLIISKVLYTHLVGGVFDPSPCGHGCREYSTDLRGNYIHVTRGDETAKFTVKSVVDSIQSQLIAQPQQLKMF